MIYERGNAAKQWILADIDQRFGDRPIRVLDLASGSCRIWQTFLESHPQLLLVGVDIDTEAIEAGKKMYANHSNVDVRVFDAQHIVDGAGFDVVVALSAMEHVVDAAAFVKTALQALRSGGIAYFNYDAGHFRSRSIQERMMVPVSQLLAKFGVERFYMKQVDDDAFVKTLTMVGFTVLGIRKGNIGPVKGFMRGATDETLAAWFAFEETLNNAYSAKTLDRLMWSTTVIVQKP